MKKLLNTLSLLLALASAAPAGAQGTADALVRRISTEVITATKADASIQGGDINKVIALVDAKVMPSVNFEIMTRSAVGPQWRSASAEQRQRLQDEFKLLLVRVYAGALSEIKDQTVEITKTLPVPGGTQVVVQTEVRGKGEPLKLDYRLDKAGEVWKIIDVNIAGIWLVTSYRSQFSQELSAGGIDGLIAKLAERNKAAKS
ncbi:MAG: ABC transporter substrate-binding protein [Rubrivivax sp.]|nr:ABC transporter substrate-binding protein [Rubrivivax sp.]MDP3086024.1 ABC transporter substrate-binding protein [Rubrivivax sp.]